MDHSPIQDKWTVVIKGDGIVQVGTMCTCGDDACAWYAAVGWNKSDIEGIQDNDAAMRQVVGNGYLTSIRD